MSGSSDALAMSASVSETCQRANDGGRKCSGPALRWVAGTCGIHATVEEIDDYLRIDRSARSHPSAA